jgi:hypothetical protein
MSRQSHSRSCERLMSAGCAFHERCAWRFDRCLVEEPAVRRGNFARAAIEVEPALVKMADLDRIEAIDFFNQALANGSTEQIKWMRSEAKNRLATSLT